MLNWIIFWFVAVLFMIGHALLIRAAVRLRHNEPIDPHGPRSTPTADLSWTIITAVLTAGMLAAIYQAMLG